MNKDALLKMYEDGVGALIDQGAVRSRGDFIIMRGITQAQTSAYRGILLETAQEMNDVRQALAFEVIEVGSKVEDLKPGMHCLPASNAIMPVRGKKESGHVVVHQQDIVMYWVPEEVDTSSAEVEDEKLELGAAAVKKILEGDGH